MKALERELRERFGARIRSAMPLAELTSFRIGGPAGLFVTVEDETELMHAKAAAYRAGVPCFCLGAGTNLLVSDRGMRGLVVRLGDGFGKIKINDTKVVAGAAAAFDRLVQAVVDRALEGLEFGEGIPGTVGGALVMNAGAFGGEIAKVVTLVHGVAEVGEAIALTTDEVKFAYRRTELPAHFVITRVDFELGRGDRAQLMARVAELKATRASRQLGGAAFSDQHANFIVNLGGAQAAEVRALIDMARVKVKEQSGVWLEPEVRLVGDW